MHLNMSKSPKRVSAHGKIVFILHLRINISNAKINVELGKLVIVIVVNVFKQVIAIRFKEPFVK